MAPVGRVDQGTLEEQVKDTIQDLYQIMVQASTYDTTGRPSRDVLSNGVKTLSRSLQTIHATASSQDHDLPHVPPELVQYVENGRNPDIYTREFVELVRRGNQLMCGKMNGFEAFGATLGRELCAAMPELRADVAALMGAGDDAVVEGPPVGENPRAEASVGLGIAETNPTDTPVSGS